ncbi:three-Cys-motif partner protein TcmP [Streptomyces sp. ISL-43]|uniref:three-Cys-motif partner protein TcmP n=1 Tax=Streptomyces sp. ISL-43 TaxID=2819183 RepID=UPI001BE737BB|nr:three-Cys-motif partner protein TcmP [Streptomyces sp. ISL-43]MBT2452744.1 three-Cys-motif partner protein TcmP [Streptomyces sp. ISL-43]
MVVPKKVWWDRDPHTAAKHDLLRKYLQPWAPILLSRYDSIAYAEGFSGPGVYSEGEPGSPIIAFNVFAGVLEHRPKHIRMVLVEGDKRRESELRTQIGKARGEPSDDVNRRISVSTHHGECHPTLLEQLRAQGCLGSPLFVLLDSYGGPDIPFSLLQELARHRSTEVMVTFAPSFLTRFAERDEKHRNAGDTAFGGTQWQEVFHRHPSQKFAFLRDQYSDTLRRAGFSHTLTFEMVDEKGHVLYLIFGTRHELGLEKMKEAMWSVDRDHGIRYRDPKDTQQQQLTLELEPNTAPLRRILLEHVSRSPEGMTVAELKTYTLLETVYKPGQVTNLIRQMRDASAVTTTPRRVTAETLVLPYVPPHEQTEPSDQTTLF